MARNGSGTYNRVAGTPYVYNTVIDQAVVNSELDDIATALTASIAKDGQTTPTNDLPMGTYKHTGVGAATARTQYARAAEVQDGSLTHLTSVAGTDTITASAALSMTAYVVGQSFEFIPANTNTGAMTLNINSIGAGAVQLNGAALASGTIRQNVPVRVKVTATTPVFEIIGNGAFRQGLAASGANSDITSLTALTGVAIGANGIGYTSGGTVTQATSKSTSVTLNKITGKITTHNASLAGNTTVQFQVNNNLVGINDVVSLGLDGMTTVSYASYAVDAFVRSDSSFYITIRNLTAGALADALDIHFVVHKGAAS